MIGYALAKTGVHTLAMNMFGSILPSDSSIITILPYIIKVANYFRETIDTPGNREAMPKADFSTWAKPDQISGLVRSWAEGLNRPISGSMVHLRVKNSTVIPEFV
jgi:dihydropteridine reductase